MDSTTAGNEEQSSSLLSVQNLLTTFYTDKEVIRAVDGVDLSIDKGQTVGLVGESGSGKSVTARSIMGLVDSPGQIDQNSSIRFKGEELTNKSEDEYQSIRGGDIAMIFQDPLTSLNPVYTVGNQIKEALSIHQELSGAEATNEAVSLLKSVGISDARRRLQEYPHQFSGGMRQRAVIAMALACDPELLLCDEPTTALDVTIQAQILELLQSLQRDRDLAILFITHDIGVIAEICDYVNVMYAGEIVESAPIVELFQQPRHPYTRGLLQSIPGNQPSVGRLDTIEGDVPTPNSKPTSCRFAPRCPEAFDACFDVHPSPVNVDSPSENHTSACLLYPEEFSESERIGLHRRSKRMNGANNQ